LEEEEVSMAKLHPIMVSKKEGQTLPSFMFIYAAMSSIFQFQEYN